MFNYKMQLGSGQSTPKLLEGSFSKTDDDKKPALVLPTLSNVFSFNPLQSVQANQSKPTQVAGLMTSNE